MVNNWNQFHLFHSNQIPEMLMEPDGEATHKRLCQDHLSLLHLPCPHLDSLHVIVQKKSKNK